MKTRATISLFVLILLSGLDCFAQSEETIFKEVISKDSVALNALALYPENVRTIIFETCTHPEILVRMDAMQQNTKEQFKELLSLYSKEEQQKIWDITRYPGLVNQLADDEIKTEKELSKILEAFPAEIRETALEYGRSHYDAFIKINQLNNDAGQAFEAIIKSYPRAAQSAFRELIKYPELITILNSNMQMAVLVGDMYKHNPGLIKRKLDSLNIVLAEQNAKDMKDWQEGLEKDPEAKKEFEESAKEYARSEGYHDEDLVVNDTRVVVEYVPYPYPYWFGYPWWWDYPYWYPHPYWYDWGYYYGPYGMVYIGYPSWYFMHWHFYNYHHHYHYPHFSDYCINHYYGHRKSFNDANRCVNEWVETNRPHLPEHFLDNDQGRVQRLKEYGKFEMDYEQHKAKNPGKEISRNDFLKENKTEYRNMEVAPPGRPEGEPAKKVQEQKYDYWDKKRDEPRYERYNEPARQMEKENPAWQQQKPVIRFPQQAPEYHQKVPQNQVPKVRPQNSSPVKKGTGGKRSSKVDPTLREDFNKMNEAQNYHRNGWINR